MNIEKVNLVLLVALVILMAVLIVFLLQGQCDIHINDRIGDWILTDPGRIK